MLEGFFYGQKKLPIISFSYIVPIRKENIYYGNEQKTLLEICRLNKRLYSNEKIS